MPLMQRTLHQRWEAILNGTIKEGDDMFLEHVGRYAKDATKRVADEALDEMKRQAHLKGQDVTTELKEILDEYHQHVMVVVTDIIETAIDASVGELTAILRDEFERLHTRLDENNAHSITTDRHSVKSCCKHPTDASE